MGKCKVCGKKWRLIGMEDEHTFCNGCGNTRPSEEFFYDGDELLTEIKAEGFFGEDLNMEVR